MCLLRTCETRIFNQNKTPTGKKKYQLTTTAVIAQNECYSTLRLNKTKSTQAAFYSSERKLFEEI